MAKGGRRPNGDGGAQGSDFGNSPDEGKENVTTFTRVLTVVAYIVGVSSAACLLSAYYVFLWVPHPSDPLTRPTDSPFSLAQHGNKHGASGSVYHYSKNSYSMDTSNNNPSSRGSKKSHGYKTTVPPNYLPKPQQLLRRKVTKQTTPSPRTRF